MIRKIKVKDFLFLLPAFVIIGFAVVKIIEDGLFSIKGVPIPWNLYNPHALTVIVWSMVYIVLYLKTNHLVWWVRFVVIVFLSLSSTFITHDIGWNVEQIVLVGSFNPIIGSEGYPTFLALSVIGLIYLYALNLIHSFLQLNKWFFIMLGLFCLSLIILVKTGFWEQWQSYVTGIVENPPHSWSWLFYIVSGQFMWLTLLKTKEKENK